MPNKRTASRKNKCSFCGCTYETFSFKHGYVCDGCLQYIKSRYKPDVEPPADTSASGDHVADSPAANDHVADEQERYSSE